MLTFTYDEEHVRLDPGTGLPTLRKLDWQNFMKDLRDKVGPGLKYYMCGEYGEQTQRPHYHAIMFNLPLHWLTTDKLEQVWKKGQTHVAPGNEITMRYVAKYLMKNTFNQPQELVNEETGELLPDTRELQFSLMSKGMGADFLTPQMEKFLKDNMTTRIKMQGKYWTLPRYYRDKVFNEFERKELARLGRETMEKRFEEAHDSCPIHEGYWKEDMIRKQKKAINERTKI